MSLYIIFDRVTGTVKKKCKTYIGAKLTLSKLNNTFNGYRHQIINVNKHQFILNLKIPYQGAAK